MDMSSFPIRRRSASFLLSIGILLGADGHPLDAFAAAAVPVPRPVTVNADGSFTPATLRIRDGETVEWTLHDRTDAIVQSSLIASIAAWRTCLPAKRWEPTDLNNLVGPMPEGASGLFTLGPFGNDKGFVSTTEPCIDGSEPVAVSPVANADGSYDQLCATGPLGATMPETWQSDDITGVHIRLLWNQVQPTPDTFFFDDLARELDNAVANGKLYSLSIKAGKHGTPDWIFSTGVDPETGELIPRENPGPVTRLLFRDGSSKAEQCGPLMSLGNPTEQAYQELWGALHTALAEFIKSRADWYRALAYIRLSGANLFTAEARLPNQCTSGCDLCNTQVWANAGYRPSKLYAFYEWQEDLFAELFPGKPMSYQLIQAGFPRVNESGCWMVGEEGVDAYTVCPLAGAPFPGPPSVIVPGTALLPKGTEQTEEILARGVANQHTRFHVQHNGLGPAPDAGACPTYQVHPALGPYAGAADGCPNRWVLEAGALTPGQLTGFQTNNATGVADAGDLDSAIQNAWDNSDAAYLEIYEQRHWEAQRFEQAGLLQASGNTLGQWTERLHHRRKNSLAAVTTVPDPFPLKFSYTFHKEPGQAETVVNYYNAGKCGPGNPKSGSIIIEGL